MKISLGKIIAFFTSTLMVTVVQADCDIEYHWSGSWVGPFVYVDTPEQALHMSCENIRQQAVDNADWENCTAITQCNVTYNNISEIWVDIPGGGSEYGHSAIMNGEVRFFCDHVATGDSNIEHVNGFGFGTSAKALNCADDQYAGPSCLSVGNPINLQVGNKYQEEVDLSWKTLRIARHYNSELGGWSHRNLSRLVHHLENGPASNPVHTM